MNKKILILVPHQDDEINIAGDRIIYHIEKKDTVYVCYSTNGDYRIKDTIRINEGVKACKKLGIPRPNIFFLGYPDTGTDSSAIIDNNCLSITHADSSSKTKINLSAFTHDVESLISTIRPDIIYCIDCDNHTDHKILSYVFERAMGNILRTVKNYTPLVLKGFAYDFSF